MTAERESEMDGEGGGVSTEELVKDARDWLTKVNLERNQSGWTFAEIACERAISALEAESKEMKRIISCVAHSCLHTSRAPGRHGTVVFSEVQVKLARRYMGLPEESRHDRAKG